MLFVFPCNHRHMSVEGQGFYAVLHSYVLSNICVHRSYVMISYIDTLHFNSLWLTLQKFPKPSSWQKEISDQQTYKTVRIIKDFNLECSQYVQEKSRRRVSSQAGKPESDSLRPITIAILFPGKLTPIKKGGNLGSCLMCKKNFHVDGFSKHRNSEGWDGIFILLKASPGQKPASCTLLKGPLLLAFQQGRDPNYLLNSLSLHLTATISSSVPKLNWLFFFIFKRDLVICF